MIDKLTLATTHTNAMAAFYGAVFDVPLSPRDVGGDTVWLGAASGVEFLLVPRSLANVHARDNTVQVRFVVADLRAALEAAVRHGGILIAEPARILASRLAAVRDPDGNFVELVQHGVSQETKE